MQELKDRIRKPLFSVLGMCGLSLAGCFGQLADEEDGTGANQIAPVMPGSGGAATSEPSDPDPNTPGSNFGPNPAPDTPDPPMGGGNSGSGPTGCAPGAACTDAVWHCSDFCYGGGCCLLSCNCKGGHYSCSKMC